MITGKEPVNRKGCVALVQKRMRAGQMVFWLAVMALLAWLTFHILFKNHSAKALCEAFSEADLRYVLLGAVCMACYALLEGESIRTMMRAFCKEVSVFRSLGYAFADFYFSAITPSATGGQPMQLYYMVRDGYGFAQSSFTLLLMAAVYQLMVLVYGLFMVLCDLPYVLGQGALIKWLLVFGILVNGACSLGILLIIRKRSLVERIAAVLIAVIIKLRIVKNRKKLEEKAGRLIDEYSRGGECIRRYPLIFIKLLLLTGIRLTVLFLTPYFACLALGIPTQGPLRFLVLQAILSLAVTAVPLPGSMGASEGGFLLLYGGVIGGGKLFPLMLLSRGISFYGFFAVSGILTLVLQLLKRKRPSPEV